MTPTKKGRTTCIKIEKVRKTHIDDTKVEHQGGGANKGLVINKQIQGGCLYMCVCSYVCTTRPKVGSWHERKTQGESHLVKRLTYL